MEKTFEDKLKDLGRVLHLSEGILQDITKGLNGDNLPDEPSFMRWANKQFVIVPFYLVVLCSIGIVIMEICGVNQATINKIIYPYEFCVLLLMLVKTVSTRNKVYIVSDKYKTIRRGADAEKTFISYWLGLIFCWTLFYFLFSCRLFDPSLLPQVFYKCLIDSLNNLTGVLFFCLYYEAVEETQDGKKRTPPWIVGLVLVICAAFCEGIILHGNSSSEYFFDFVFGLFVGICTGLFVGRLQSIILNIPFLLIFYFTLYAIIQPGYFVFDPLVSQKPAGVLMRAYEILGVVIFMLAFYAKVLLFMIIQWMKDTDRLLYYMIRHQRLFTEETKSKYREIFAKIIAKIEEEEDKNETDA